MGSPPLLQWLGKAQLKKKGQEENLPNDGSESLFLSVPVPGSAVLEARPPWWSPSRESPSHRVVVEPSVPAL